MEIDSDQVDTKRVRLNNIAVKLAKLTKTVDILNCNVYDNGSLQIGDYTFGGDDYIGVWIEK